MTFRFKTRYAILILSIIIFYIIFSLGRNFCPNAPSRHPNSTHKKVILSWTKFWNNLMDDKRYFKWCPELREICDLTIDQSRYADADAIVFHPPNINWSHLPPSRYFDQRYVFFMQEPPTTQATRIRSKNSYNVNWIPRFFNWSMTYRLDSDISYPYGFLAPNILARRELDTAAILNKVKSVVWFVSNCKTPSKREIYIDHLKKYIPIDIYGLCGDRTCSRNESAKNRCDKEMIDKEYKFYIAFENSICRDYITEKFYGRQHLNSVPIVLSRRIAENLLPPKSFIAADDFPAGPRQLAEYLKQLMENDAEYLKYFEWKRNGYTMLDRHPFTGIRWGFCGLCEKLWRLDRNGNQEIKVYERVDAWLGSKTLCHSDLVDSLLISENLAENISSLQVQQ